jgi:hypothetical protein
MADSAGTPIGGAYCLAALSPGLLVGEGQRLTAYERESLWRLFVEIGRCWDDVLEDSANLKSSWLEFVEARTTTAPSYVAEYANAVAVIDELRQLYGERNAYTLLLLRSGVPDGPPATSLAHAKRYVVDEFIRVNVVASGFKSFGGRNYNGYIEGSRYNTKPRVRAYVPAPAAPAATPMATEAR